MTSLDLSNVIKPAKNYSTVISEVQFMPSVYYFAYLSAFDNVVLEQHENYNKGSFRNKCFVSGNQTSQYLIIPLKKGKNKSQPIKNVAISYDEDWIKVLEHRVQTEYGNYPYYDYYILDILSIIKREWIYLHELNVHIIEYAFEVLNFKKFRYSGNYKHRYPQKVVDLRDVITPSYFKKRPELLSSHKIGYFQFIPGHTIIEALFAYGPELKLLINEYAAKIQDFENSEKH